jgi:hypothetical protein
MRIPLLLVSWVLLGAHLLVSATYKAGGDTVAAIRSSCQMEFAKAKADRQHQIFFCALLKNEDPSRDDWKREASESVTTAAAKNGNSTASVYESQGRRVVVVAFSFRNEFGDWVNDADYCFRGDGTLAQIHSRLDSFHGDATVVRDYFFSDGKQIALERHDYTLGTTTPKKLDTGFWDFPPPVFRRVSDLPFVKKLK